MKNYRLLLIYGLVAIMAIGCSKDNKGNGGREEPINLGDEIAITFDMTVPAPGSTVTYAISGEDEHYIDNITAVIFEEVAGEEYYRYHTHATTIENGTTNAKRFRIQVKKSINGEKYRIVALTNLPADHVSDIVANLISSAQDPQTFKKEDFLKEVNFKSVGKWNTTSSIDFTPLPMWGETPAMQPISSNTTPDQLGTIKLLRSIARVDIGMDMFFSNGNHVSRGLPNFKLETVKVYNASSSGAIAPLVANLSAVPGELKAQNPTLPTGVTANTPAIDYTKAIVADWDKGFIRDIYIAESDVKNAATAQTRTCIILKGYYTTAEDLTNNNINTSVPTWYRIDFFKKGMGGNPIIEYLDILRNCRYHVNITKVSGPGYDTEAEAVNSLPMNLDADVLIWDEYEGMDDITTDGQYHLVVNRNSFEYFKEGRERILEIYADHPKGWKVLDVDLPNWIHLTPQNSDGETLPMTGKMNISLTTDPIDPSNTNQFYTREDYFTITSGVMKKKIYIKQINQPELTLIVTPKQLLFSKSGSLAKAITVETYPIGITRYFQYGGANITWEVWPGADDAFGAVSYQFKPTVNNTGKILDATITVEIVDPVSGARAFQQVTIRQLATNLLFNITNKPVYAGAGGAVKFTVDSPEAPWQLSKDITLDPLNMLSGYNAAPQLATTVPTDFGFTLTGNPTFATRIGKFLATSSDIDFPIQEIEVHQGIVAPYINIQTANANVGSAAANTLQNILFTTNTSWHYNSTHPNAADVFTFAGSNYAPTTVHAGGTNAVTPVNITHQIRTADTYKTGIAVNHIAGTDISATVSYYTDNHSPAAAPAAKAFTLTRKILPHTEAATMVPVNGTQLSYASIAAGHVNAAGQPVIKVSANTNIHIAGTANLVQATPATSQVGGAWMAAPTKWQASTTTFTVPGSWTVADRWLYIHYHNNSSGGYQPIGQILQKKWTLNGNHTVTTITRVASNHTATTTTTSYAPGYRMRTSSHPTNAWELSLWMDGAASTFIGTRAFHIPANDSWHTRPVYVYIERSGLEWAKIGGTITQAGYDLALSNTNITQGMWIGAEATNAYWVNLKTNYGAPVGRVGIFSVSTDPNAGGGTWILHPDTQGSVPHATNVAIKIPENTGVNRQLHFFFEKGGYKWEYMRGISQSGRIDLGNGWWTLPGKTVTAAGGGAISAYDNIALVLDNACTNQYGAGWKVVYRAEQQVFSDWHYSSGGAYAGATNRINILPGTIYFMRSAVPHNFSYATWTYGNGATGTSTDWNTLKDQIFTMTCARK